jgi:hypothetical protein
MSSRRQEQRRLSSQNQLVTSIRPTDVLLGRGNHVKNPGSEKFRNLVLSRSIEYWSCNNNITKDIIARQIIDEVSSLGGRFLRKIKKESTHDVPDGGPPGAGDKTSNTKSESTEEWETADMETILVKVKQTFRDFTASAKKKSAAFSAATSSSREQQRVPSLPTVRQQSVGSRTATTETFNFMNPDSTDTIGGIALEDFHRPQLPLAMLHRNAPDGNTATRNFDNLTVQELSTRRTGDTLQQCRLSSETSTSSALLEFLAQQQIISTLQRQLRRQQHHSVSDPDIFGNVNHSVTDPILSLTHNNDWHRQPFSQQILSPVPQVQPLLANYLPEISDTILPRDDLLLQRRFNSLPNIGLFSQLPQNSIGILQRQNFSPPSLDTNLPRQRNATTTASSAQLSPSNHDRTASNFVNLNIATTNVIALPNPVRDVTASASRNSDDSSKEEYRSMSSVQMMTIRKC